MQYLSYKQHIKTMRPIWLLTVSTFILCITTLFIWIVTSSNHGEATQPASNALIVHGLDQIEPSIPPFLMDFITQKTAYHKDNADTTTKELFVDYELTHTYGLYHLMLDIRTDAPENHTVYTVVFHPETEQTYRLQDFLQGDYLSALSMIAYHKLSNDSNHQNQALQQSLRINTLPVSENFENFILTDQGITFYFASSVSGLSDSFIHQISLSFEALSDYINDAWRTIFGLSHASDIAQLADANLNQKSNQKLISITFDDGPHPTLTPKLLGILQKENVPATFYLLGSRVRQYPQVVRSIMEQGHQIGSHTTNHKALTKLSAQQRDKEIQDTISLITRLTGSPPSTMRPPYGAYDDNVIAASHQPLVLWSVDPEDWKDKDAKTVYNRVVKNVKDGDIILLHDIHATSVAAAEKIIKKLKQDGYTFVTVDQLMEARGKQPASDVYYSFPRVKKPA